MVLTLTRAIFALGSPALAITVMAGAVQQPPPANPRAKVIVEFNSRLKQYLDTRQKAVSGFKALREDADQAEIASREKALGEAIRTARTAAKPGELLGAPVGDLMRALTKADFRNRSTKAKQLRLDELPKFKPVINQTYPPEWPLQTFPPTLLANMPKLPPELEYRFVDNSLILRDTKANIVVDVLTDVM